MQFLKRKMQKPLFLEKYSVNGKNYDFTKKLSLKSNENNVQIDFTTLSYIPNE